MNQSAGESYAGSFRYGQMRRKDRRAGIPGFVVNIADGNLVVEGTVADISTGGFRIRNIPEFFKAEQHTYSTVLSGGGRHFRLLAKPCWRRKGAGQHQVEMGFKIIDAPWEWVELTLREIPAFDYEEGLAVIN